jgi:tetratricopeptide (TPR) repeat protein
MSFQGDVGGIGLADLLQSLARGREGVLSLLGRDGLKSTLGIQDGLLHLLPDPDEDPEIWRNRARQAWVKDPDFRIDTLRMVEIARARRLEMLFRLLDSEGVHFRFAPGPLPERPTENALSAAEPGTERKGPRRDAVFVQPSPVEGLLLEYARLKDEAMSSGDWVLAEDAIPVALDTGSPARDHVKLYAECDGRSTVAEIADRLGWPVRQLRIVTIKELGRGSMRLAGAEELLGLAQGELAQGFTERAASRLRAWCQCAPFGPLTEIDAHVFQGEWGAERLQAVIGALPAREARTFLRRFDAAIGSPHSALDHWTELARVRRDDRISQVRLVHLQALASADPSVPSVRDLLAMSRAFLETERRLAAAAVLRIAALKAPESSNVRLEIGTNMLAAGMGAEASSWVLDAAMALFEARDHEKALPALRALVELDPANREARRLLARARAHAMQRTLVKKNSLVTIAVVLALSVGAVVQFRSQRAFDEKLEMITSRLDDPREALRILDEEFPGDEVTKVGELRRTLVEKKKIAQAAVRTAWMDRYREAQVECTVGDPLLGLKRTLEMPKPPDLGPDSEGLPIISDLYNGLAARIESQIKELGDAVDATPAQINTESRVKTQVTELEEALSAANAQAEAREFEKRLVEFGQRITDRRDKRADACAERSKQDKLSQQDLLLAAARAHAAAGDYDRALVQYKKLLESDTEGKLSGYLAKEIRVVEEKGNAIKQALELCRQGHHADAHKLLVDVLLEKRANEILLPWKIQTFPSGARAKLHDGSVRVTPFALESTWNEAVGLTVELEGHDPQAISVAHPADQFLWMSRQPERAWKTKGRVEALPVAVRGDHVVCDRNGSIARLSKNGALTWEHKLDSLGGVGRAPVFLPRNAGNLLLVTEDGEAWIIDASAGSFEGPFASGAPPVEGPLAFEDGVRVRFRDGVVYEWKTRLKPEAITSPELTPHSDTITDDDLAHGSSAGLAVLRRRSSSSATLESPWTELAVDVGPDIFTVHAKGAKEPLFIVQREGEWTYLAWEAPHMLIPQGRLWVSDGKGLRAFLP